MSFIAAASIVSSSSSTLRAASPRGMKLSSLATRARGPVKPSSTRAVTHAFGDAAGGAGFVDDEDSAGGVGLPQDVLDRAAARASACPRPEWRLCARRAGGRRAGSCATPLPNVTIVRSVPSP